MTAENELDDLRKRVDLLEATVASLARQLNTFQPELVALREISSDRFDGVDLAIDKLQHRLERVDQQVWGLRDDLPSLIGQAVRNALRPT